MRIDSGIVCLAVSAALAQSPGAAWKEFSVGPPTANRSSFARDGIRAEGVPFRRVLARAFGVPEHRIIGPAWIDTERYAMTAVVNDPKDFQPAIQQELATRWHLLVHHEMKDVPVYEIRAMDGASVLPPPAEPAAGRPRAPSVKLNQASVKAFADALADVWGRPVFDETKLDGRFDFAFTWTSTDPAALKAAMAAQLGLNLVDTRRVVDLVIVDHIEKLPSAPTRNGIG